MRLARGDGGRRRLLAFGLAWALGGGAALVTLKALPYSAAAISEASLAEAMRVPTPDFSVGGVAWNVTAWANAPELAPFRADFRSSCGAQVGLAAAVCVSDRLARAFPSGVPRTEFVNVTFDPIEHLRAHLGGRPGHCLNRSAILVTELLAVGVPARVVQVFRADRTGHTLTEVWDDRMGWTVVDPTFGAVLRSTVSHSPTSVQALISASTAVEWRRTAVIAGSTPPPYKRESYARGTALYVEPWLHLRMGKSSAPWPYRARFIRVGESQWALGPAQRAAALALLLCGAAAAACLLRATIWRRRSSPARQLVSPKGAPAERPAS